MGPERHDVFIAQAAGVHVTGEHCRASLGAGGAIGVLSDAPGSSG